MDSLCRGMSLKRLNKTWAIDEIHKVNLHNLIMIWKQFLYILIIINIEINVLIQYVSACQLLKMKFTKAKTKKH